MAWRKRDTRQDAEHFTGENRRRFEQVFDREGPRSNPSPHRDAVLASQSLELRDSNQRLKSLATERPSQTKL
jgi:hypothetical protein